MSALSDIPPPPPPPPKKVYIYTALISFNFHFQNPCMSSVWID